ncbi:hypothetical protein ACFL2R_02290 [Patescibacteria group bacterium]
MISEESRSRRITDNRGSDKDFDVNIMINGVPRPKYPYQGEIFVEAVPGEYVLRLWNGGNSRIAAVISVDGQSVVDRSPASIKNTSGARVIPPDSHIEVSGWRIGEYDRDIARFEFRKAKSSYAAQMGDSLNNLGVIGVAFFREKYSGFMHDDYKRHSFGPTLSTKGGGDGLLGERCEPQVGTGFGRYDTEELQKVSMDLEASPAGIVVIRYDQKEGLERRGIIVDDPVMAANPFPGDALKTGGCPIPPGRDR